MDSPTSDTPRQSLLGSISFLARSSRPRAPAAHTPSDAQLSPSLPASSPVTRRRTAAAVPTAPAAPPVQPSSAANSGLGYMLRRRRSATALPDAQPQRPPPAAAADSSAAAPAQPTGHTHRIRLVPHLESYRSLHFDAITRDVRQGDAPLRIGRFTDRSAHAGSSTNKLAFKSKVVSRGHAEVWFDSGSFFIKDTKSSSGTFLNHIRLSSPNTESRPHPVKDGDILQLGVDYQGGTEEIYRCVKMRVELGREWQSGVNAFNSNALQQLQTLSGAVPSKKGAASGAPGPAEKRTKSNITDCCICLFQVTVCQSLFIAPCSHVYHYKCIRPLLEMHHPGFACPLCRTFADLEADVEIEADAERGGGDVVHEEDVEMALEDVAEQEDNTSLREPPQPDPPQPHPAFAIPRRPSAEGPFPGAEATPLNSTFLATLVRGGASSAGGEGSGGSGENGGGGGGGLVAIAVSDDEDEDEDETGERGDDAVAPDDEGVAGVGGKRKR